MKSDLSAHEAADLLGVSVATLYAYVSRGLLEPRQAPLARSKTYDRDAVLRLAARRADAKRGGHHATGAMDWGLPVLETRISRIANGNLYYRGVNVLQLAPVCTLEAVASLIWDGSGNDYFAQQIGPVAPALLDLSRSLAGTLAPLERAMAMLPLWGPAADRAGGRFHHGADLMRLLTAMLLDTAPSAQPMHEQIGLAWQASAAQVDLIRAALVLLADHELNASTFVVRCASSTGASPTAVLCAGLAALSGPLHGGGSSKAGQLLHTALAAASAHAAVADYFSQHQAGLAGFGHRLYPAGDPRAAMLLARLAALAPPDSAAILEIGAIAQHHCGEAPNMDFALAALALAFGWPPQAGQILFAVARSAGWLGHAAEQADSGTLIRPRGRYVGSFCMD